MTTQEAILLAARQLFNEHGTARVTTNHIARESHISPGNLYYHYQDKSHIIRAIYEQMIRDWAKAYDRLEGKQITIAVIQAFIADDFALLWEYRFFYRETVALMKADPQLAERHETITRQRFDQQRQLIQTAVQDGILSFPAETVSLEDVLTIAWITANHYLIHLESLGQTVQKKDFESGAQLVMKVLWPYLQ